MVEKENLRTFLKSHTGKFVLSELISEPSFFIHVYWVFFLSQFSLTDDMLVLIMSLSAALPIFTIPIYEHLVRKRSEKSLGFWIGVYSLVVNSTFAILFLGLFTHNFTITVVGLFSSWFFNQFLSLEFNSVILKLARRDKSVRYSYTKLQQITEFGYAFGILAAGILTFFFGIASSVLFAIIFQAIFAARMFWLAKKYKIKDEKEKATSINLKTIKSKMNIYVVLVLAFVLFGIIMVCAEDAVSSYELNKFDFGEAMFGVQNILIMFVAVFGLGFVQKRFSLEKAFLIGIGSAILMYICLISLPNSFLFIIPAIFFTGFISNVYSNSVPLIDKYLNVSEKDATMIYKFIRIFGQFLTYYMVFGVYTAFGRKVFAAVLSIYFVVIWAMIKYVKRERLVQAEKADIVQNNDLVLVKVEVTKNDIKPGEK